MSTVHHDKAFLPSKLLNDTVAWPFDWTLPQCIRHKESLCFIEYGDETLNIFCTNVMKFLHTPFLFLLPHSGKVEYLGLCNGDPGCLAKSEIKRECDELRGHSRNDAFIKQSRVMTIPTHAPTLFKVGMRASAAFLSHYRVCWLLLE